MHSQFMIINFIIPVCFLLCTTFLSSPAMSDGGVTLHKSVGAMSLHLDKEIYYMGDAIPIYYSYPPHKEESEKGISYELTVGFAGDEAVNVLNAANSILDAEYWKSGAQEPYNDVFVLEVDRGSMKLRERISRDVTVKLIRKQDGVVTREIKKYFHLRQPKYKPIPGALNLPDGGRFDYTDLPVVQLNLPSSIKDVSDFAVELFYLSAQTSGGAIENNPVATYDYFNSTISPRPSHHPIGGTTVVKSHTQEIKLENMWTFLYPGTYEFRLIRQGHEWSNGAGYNATAAYVVDSVRFEIVVENWDKALRVLSPDNLDVNKSIILRIDGAELPFKNPDSTSLEYYDVFLYKVVDDVLGLCQE